MSRILVAEDEARIASFIAKGLSASGLSPVVVEDGPTAMAMALTGEFDLLVLDIVQRLARPQGSLAKAQRSSGLISVEGLHI